MSDRQQPNTDRPFRIIRRLTRDAVIDIWEGSRQECGAWRCVPIPPADPCGPEGWEIFDSSRDYKTEWFRRCKDHVVEAKLGGGGGTKLRGGDGATLRARVFFLDDLW
jgi:hypothetical protein